MITTTIKVFVNSWGSYNEYGIGNGEWLEYTVGEDDEWNKKLEEYQEKLNKIEPNLGEELFCNSGFECEDYDFINEFCEKECDEIWPGHLPEKLKWLKDIEEYDMDKLEKIIEVEGWGYLEDAIKHIDDWVFWDCDSLADLGETVFKEYFCDVKIPEQLEYFIDWEGYGRNLTYDNFWECSNGYLEKCY